MKNNNQDKDFIENCRKIDFSAESMNQEKNLEILKTKIWNIDDERENIMHKKIRKPIAFAAVSAALLCFTITVYGQDLVRIIKTMTLGNYAKYQVVEDLRESVPLPENLIGQVFDKDGNMLTEYAKDLALYNAEGQEVTIYIDGDTAKIATIEEYQKIHDYKTFDFYDLQEGKSYFICDILMPTYLPDGYSFKYISYYSDPRDETNAEEDANKYMDVYYSNGKDEIYSQIRFMDEETAFESSGSENIQKIKINGYDAVIDGNALDIQIGDVMYMFFANENLDMNELVKVAESLK